MVKITALRIISVLTFAIMFTVYSETFACGPFFEEAVFVYAKHPDYPFESFARGQLGIIRPTYARSYLYAAYSYMNGRRFNDEEQKELVSLWEYRLKNEQTPDDGGVGMWLKARSVIPDITPLENIEVYRTVPGEKNTYNKFYNCPSDAFVSAATKLAEKVKREGRDSARVKAWVAAQDQVFSNCSEGHAVPAPALSEESPAEKAERAYQIAAAKFYATDYDGAYQAFMEIRDDGKSPWKVMSPYLAARSLVRKASLIAGAEKNDNALLSKAKKDLENILADKNLAETHSAANRLLDLVALRLQPEEQIMALARRLASKNIQASLRQNLWDYTSLIDKVSPDPDTWSSETKKFKDLPAVVSKDDMTDWLLTFQVAGEDALAHSLQMWKRTSSTPWLLASLAKVGPNHPMLGTLLEASNKIQPDSPGYLSVAYYRLRLLRESGRAEQARTELDRLLGVEKSSGTATITTAVPTAPSSARNLLLRERTLLARNLDELVKFSQRVPLTITDDGDAQELPSELRGGEDVAAQPGDEVTKEKQSLERKIGFDSDSAQAFNQGLPLELLNAASTNNSLPLHLRRRVALATWVRAVLIGNHKEGKAAAVILTSYVPELKELLEQYIKETGKSERQHSAIFAMLKTPAMRPYVDANLGREPMLMKIDSYRDNWWCALNLRAPLTERNSSKQAMADEQSNARSEESAGAKPFEFLSDAQKRHLENDWQQLSQIETGPNYLCRQVIEWAIQNPNDPRLPEALHLAIKATRYGCTDPGTGKLSRDAFQILHQRFPTSEWAKNTPYWFK